MVVLWKFGCFEANFLSRREKKRKTRYDRVHSVSNFDYLQEHFRVFSKRWWESLRIEFPVDCQQEKFNPTHIPIWSDSLVSVAKWVRRPYFLFLKRRQGEELDCFWFQFGDELHRNAVIDHLEETELLAGGNEAGFRVGFRQVYYGNFGGECGGFAILDERDVFDCWLGQNHHCWWKSEGFGFLQKNGNCRDGLFLVTDWNEWKKIDVCVWECINLRRMEKGMLGYL